MLCPHAQFRTARNQFAATEPLSTYLASIRGCPECDLLLRVVEEFKPGWIAENKNGQGSIDVIHKVGGRYDSIPATINLLVSRLSRGNDWFKDRELVDSLQYFRRSREEPMYEDMPAPSTRAALYQTLDIVEDSHSKTAFDRAAKWLSYCLDHDEQCRPPSSDFTPPRLLNVGSTESRHLFLLEPVKSSPYVCLSYCWGANIDKILMTTKENLETHYHGVPYSLLPRTIRDAITCCRGLNISYLWVDSLCIVQDDRDDWLFNSAQMHKIYQNSCLTIAAEEPASSDLGFLGKQQFGSVDWQQRFNTYVPSEAGGPGNEIFIRPRLNRVHPEERDKGCSLDKRGWCLQETILPNRRLCFNGNEMTWECLQRRLCECGHTMWAPTSIQYGALGASIKLGSNRSYADWRALVEQYSDRSLTRTTDKLIAVSGLAKTIANNLRDAEGVPDVYVAGLWKREFLLDLTWRVIALGPELQSFQPYRAPSWSWASVDGSIRYEAWKMVSTWKYKPKQRADCVINEIICHNELPFDETSAVKAAHAILTGFLAPVELAVLDEALSEVWKSDSQRHLTAFHQRSLVRSKNLWSLEVFLDHPMETSVRAEDVQSDCWMQGRCTKQCCHWECRDPAEHPKEEPFFYGFRLFTWTAAGKIDESDRIRMMPPEMWYLVLRKSHEPTGAFERVGIGFWSARSDRRSEAQGDDCPLFEGCETTRIKIV